MQFQTQSRVVLSPKIAHLAMLLIANSIVDLPCTPHIHTFHSTYLQLPYSMINPRRMREGYGSRSVCLCVCVCVCVSVCYRTSGYIPCL